MAMLVHARRYDLSLGHFLVTYDKHIWNLLELSLPNLETKLLVSVIRFYP